MTDKKPKTQNSLDGGCLYLVATPIGNLEDITLRALSTLKEADAILCEDTRRTLKLLSHYGISKRLVSYHEHNEFTRSPEVVLELEQGAKIALVSDAGTPTISDPGHRLTTLCIRHGIRVVPIPGPSAFVTALAASGMPANEFLFLGFLPKRSAARRQALRKLAAETRTLVLYEAPHRLLDSLEDAVEIMGNRQAVIAREITKTFEEFQRGGLEELLAAVRKKTPRGEITLILGAPPMESKNQARTASADAIESVPLSHRVSAIMAEGSDRKAALKQAARERGLTRREAYRQLLITRDE